MSCLSSIPGWNGHLQLCPQRGSSIPIPAPCPDPALIHPQLWNCSSLAAPEPPNPGKKPTPDPFPKRHSPKCQRGEQNPRITSPQPRAEQEGPNPGIVYPELLQILFVQSCLNPSCSAFSLGHICCRGLERRKNEFKAWGFPSPSAPGG